MERLRGWLVHALRRAPVALAAVVVLLVDSPALAIAAFLAADLAYVGYVSVSVAAARRRPSTTGDAEAERRWAAFRTRASWLMDVAAVAFVALAIVTRDTLPWPAPRAVAIAAGLALGAVGLGTKTWAAASLPRANYFWRDAFFPGEPSPVSRSGPYRFLANPMYTLGYAHAYGMALLVLSLPALAGAALSQALILLFNALVERPVASGRAAAAVAGTAVASLAAHAPAPVARS
jgi:protein-S-isoprenylcysteine O-methyltransferase Ste14